MMIHKERDGGISRERVSWKEWLWLVLPDPRRSVGVGEQIPMFYLPVGQHRVSGQIYCWIAPLAPFVLFALLFKHAFQSVWFDLVELRIILEEIMLQKRDWRGFREEFVDDQLEGVRRSPDNPS